MSNNKAWASKESSPLSLSLDNLSEQLSRLEGVIERLSLRLDPVCVRYSDDNAKHALEPMPMASQVVTSVLGQASRISRASDALDRLCAEIEV